MATQEREESFGLPEHWSPSPPAPPSRNRAHYAILLLAAAMLAAVVGILYLPGAHKPEGPVLPIGERPPERVSQLSFPAPLLWRISLSRTDSAGNVTSDSAIMPADLAVVDGRIFILDTNNSRILEFDRTGRARALLDSSRDPRLELKQPMAMAAHDGKLYVTNSGGGNLVVVDTVGNVDRVITPAVPAAAKPLRPVGIAVAANGDVFISDPDNHRVLRLDPGGVLLQTIGLGVRDSGAYGMNTPGGVALDNLGNIYVVDMLNYSVKKYSPAGEFTTAFGEAGDTEATFSRPKGVIVDEKGRIFTSDTLLVAVQVFESDGRYAGFIGRKQPSDRMSGSMFQAPHGMKIAGDTLYVIDRFAGLFAFRLP